jgi:hypothetical protein
MNSPQEPNKWGNNYEQMSAEKTNTLSSPIILDEINPLTQGQIQHKQPKSNKFGITVMIIMLSVAFLSISTSITSGILLLGYMSNGGTEARLVYTENETLGFLLIFANAIIGTIIGVLVIVFSIIAIVKNQGRSYAILALICAVITPIVGFIGFFILVS